MADIKDDIVKYLNGELSPAQMHALERKALSDPFLAEALEGASSVSREDFDKDLDQLQQALIDKTRRRSGGRAFHWNWPMRIAAGLILLAISSYLVLNLVQKNKEQKDLMALNKQEATPAPEASPGQSSKSSEDNFSPSVENDKPVNKPEETGEAKTILPGVSLNKAKPSVESAEVEEGKEEAKPYNDSPSAQPDQAAGPSNEVIQPERQKMAELSKESIAQSEAAPESTGQERMFFEKKEKRRMTRSAPDSYGYTSDDMPKSELPQASSFTLSDSIQALSVAVTKVIRGKVTDIDDGLPIPGVNVVAKGNQAGTVTDLNGNYQLTVPADEDQLVFSFIGLETKEVEIPVADDNPKKDTRKEVDVTMSQDVSELSEVVVVGYGEQNDKEFDGTRWELAEPEGGRKAFKDYLEKNLLYPQVAIENNVEGKVSVQFTIQPNGQLTDFRVMKSLGYGCDEEVIRLIKEGPQWKPTKRNSEPVLGKGKVKMRFALPRKKKE